MKTAGECRSFLLSLVTTESDSFPWTIMRRRTARKTVRGSESLMPHFQIEAFSGSFALLRTTISKRGVRLIQAG